MIKKLDFYFVDNKYIQYFHEEEKKIYGDAKTPVMLYPERCNPKFLCGPLFTGMSGVDYYVPVSSYSKQKNGNVLIIFPGDKDPVKGSLRLNYMIPVPEEIISRYSIKDIKKMEHKLLLMKEYEFVQDFSGNIRHFARTLYNDIYNQKCSLKLLINSCRMKFLENRCADYCISMGYRLPCRPYPKYTPQDDKVLSFIEKNTVPEEPEFIEI